LEEMWEQGRREEREGVMRSPFTEKGPPIGEMTIDFTKTFVLPLFILLQRMMPEMSVCLSHVERNLELWEVEDAKARAASEASSSSPTKGKDGDDSASRQSAAYQRGLLSTRHSQQATANRRRRNSAV